MNVAWTVIDSLTFRQRLYVALSVQMSSIRLRRAYDEVRYYLHCEFHLKRKKTKWLSINKSLFSRSWMIKGLFSIFLKVLEL